jgi:hypothetical protein
VTNNFYPEVRRDGISAAQKRAHRAFLAAGLSLSGKAFMVANYTAMT